MWEKIFDFDEKLLPARLKTHSSFLKIFSCALSFHSLTQLIREARENVANPPNELNRPKTHFLVEPLLINQEARYSDQEIRDHLLTLLITASDTTVNLVGACLLFLAINQEIQQRVHDEIVEVFGDDDDAIEFDYERLNELRYLERVLKETLRVFSPIPIYIRECIEDCDIGIGVTVKRDTKIFILNHVMHHREDIWGREARRFDPDNFSADKIAERDSSAFIPFGSVGVIDARDIFTADSLTCVFATL